MHLRHLFPYVPGQSGYNKRLRRGADQLRAVIRLLALTAVIWHNGQLGKCPVRELLAYNH